MIKVTGRKLYIPQSDKILGFQGDNLCETRHFLINDNNISDLSFKLDVLEYDCCIDLEKEKSETGVLLTWQITSGITQNSGMLNVQLRGFNEENELVWHSEIETFFVGDSVNASKHIENVALTEFEQIEKRATLAKNEAIDYALVAKEHVQNCEDIRDECGEYAKECEENVNVFSGILDIHKHDDANPHNVTASQVGAYSISEMDVALGMKANDYDLYEHKTNVKNPHNVTAEQVGTYTSKEIDSKLIPAAYINGNMEFTQDNVTIVSGYEYANWYDNTFSTSDGDVVYHIAVSGKVDFSGYCSGSMHTIRIDGITEVPVSYDEHRYDYKFSYSGEVKEYIEVTVAYASVTFESFTAETCMNGLMTGKDKAMLYELNANLGNIDEALDSILAIQDALIGGATE